MQEYLKTNNSVYDFGDTVENIVLPEIRKTQADIANKWYRHQPELTIQTSNLNLRTKPEYFPIPEYNNSSIFFKISCQQAETLIGIEKELIIRLIDSLYEEQDFETLSPIDQALLLEFLLSPAIEKFEKENSLEVSITPFADDIQVNSNEVLTGHIQITGSKTSYPFYIALPAENYEVWSSLLNRNYHYHTSRQLQLEQTVTVSLSLNYRCMEIDIGTLKNLDTGDVILLESGDKQQPFMELRAANKQIWLGRKIPEQNAVEILAIQKTPLLAGNSAEFNKDNNVMSEHDDGTVIDDIPVTMTFEVGRKDITVRDLGDLQEGSVISFPGEDTKEVCLVINGKEIGWGTLVRVGDDIGVKIERIFVNG